MESWSTGSEQKHCANGGLLGTQKFVDAVHSLRRKRMVRLSGIEPRSHTDSRNQLGSIHILCPAGIWFVKFHVNPTVEDPAMTSLVEGLSVVRCDIRHGPRFPDC